MKHVIIGGCARSGKTTLSLKLRDKGFIHYKMDTIKRGLDNNFYAGKIKLWTDASPKFAKLITRIISEADTDIISGIEWYIIDTTHLYPKDIVSIYNPKNTIIVFLGYPNMNAKDKVKKIREYDPKNGWTWTKDDLFLENSAKEDIEYSIEAKKECEENNIMFFDTEDFNKGINEAYNYIINNLND